MIVNSRMALLWFGKHGIGAYDMGTLPSERDRAYLKMFEDIDNIGYYNVIDSDDVGYPDLDQREALALAKRGDAFAAKWLIEMRSGYEYERYEVVTLR